MTDDPILATLARLAQEKHKRATPDPSPWMPFDAVSSACMYCQQRRPNHYATCSQYPDTLAQHTADADHLDRAVARLRQMATIEREIGSKVLEVSLGGYEIDWAGIAYAKHLLALLTNAPPGEETT